MEPIKIKKISPEKLKAVSGTMHHLRFMPSNTRLEASTQALLMDVRKKLLSKEVSLNPFATKVDITFKYYEANVLEDWLRLWLVGEPNTYEKTLISAFADELNQKMA